MENENKNSIENNFDAAISPYEMAFNNYTDLLDPLLDLHEKAQIPRPVRSDYLSPEDRELRDEKIREGASYRKVLEPLVIGRGGFKIVYGVEHEGEPLALKVTDDDQWSKAEMRDDCEALFAGRGVKGLEQLVATNLDKNVMLTTRMPGKEVSEMTSKELFGIQKHHLTQLTSLLKEMDERGLHPHNAGGIFFDSEAGFSFVDYTLKSQGKNDVVPLQSLRHFLYYALADHRKIGALNHLAQQGMKVPSYSYETTGIRSLRRASLMRKAARLEKKAQTGI